MSYGSRNNTGVIIAVLLVLSLCSYWFFDSERQRVTQPSSEPKIATESTPSPKNPLASTGTIKVQDEPTYADARWPTTEIELLAIPEASRWYNSRNSAGSYGTIAGPVAGVYQATESNGMPVFVNIGNDYPSSNRAQIIIWGDRVAEFEDMLMQIDHGSAWVSVTGYISEYDGVTQIDVSDSNTEWQWWTDVYR